VRVSFDNFSFCSLDCTRWTVNIFRLDETLRRHTLSLEPGKSSKMRVQAIWPHPKITWKILIPIHRLRWSSTQP
jgi:hypothetical protein